MLRGPSGGGIDFVKFTHSKNKHFHNAFLFCFVGKTTLLNLLGTIDRATSGELGNFFLQIDIVEKLSTLPKSKFTELQSYLGKRLIQSLVIHTWLN